MISTSRLLKSSIKKHNIMPDNIDPEEIARFDKIAKQWWDLEGEMKPLHQMNPIRLSYIQKHTPLAQKKVLDIGCGGGILSESLARAGTQQTSIDKSEALLAIAKQHAIDEGLQIDYQNITAERLAQEQASSFDIITCMEMLEHVPNPESIIQACSKLLKPGGTAFFSTINRHPKAYLFAILGAEYLLNLLPKGTHQYQYFIKPSELADWARTRHFSLEDLTGMQYQPITQQFSLTRDVKVNYLACFKRSNDD